MNIQLLTLLNLFLVCVKAQTRCQVANRAPGMPGAPTIECEANGDYKPRQCNYSARTCYCVTINGENIPNTWWSLVASDNASPKDCVAERLRYAGGNNNFITTTSSPGKAGSCPTATGFGTCISNCQRDTDCFGSLKCCSNGCGQTCQSPVNSVFPLTTPTPFANSGTCPDPTSVGGICGNFCLRDSDCQSLGNRKCCSNGCGFNCVDPIYNALPTRFPNPNDPCSGNPCPVGQTCTPITVNCFVPPCPSLYQCTANNNPQNCRDPNSRFDQCGGNPQCQETCNNLGQLIACPSLCVPGCVCNTGFVWQSNPGSNCVLRTQCRPTPSPSGQPQIVTQAVVTIMGTVANPNVRGNLNFSQFNGVGPVMIVGTLQGLPAGSHGFHIHEYGDISNNCIAAGAHFNPAGQLHNGPTDSVRHVGDLGNIAAVTTDSTPIYLQDSIVSLNGRNSIVGRAIVIHEKADDLGRGGNEESRKTGNAGTRLACGVIGVKAIAS